MVKVSSIQYNISVKENSIFSSQRLGALSSTDTLFEYEIPSRKKLADLGVEGDSLNITVGFSILGGQVKGRRLHI